MIMTNKPILDACCGSRMFWKDHHNPNVLYVDNRQLHCTAIWKSTSGKSTRYLTIEPDIVADFTALPFADETFVHVVFDTPHLINVCCPLSPSTMRRDAKRWPKTAAMLFLGHCKKWDKAVAAGGVTERGKPYRMLEWGTPRAAFEHWLDTGMTINNEKPTEDEPCLFAGTGYSESDVAEGGAE